MSRLIVSDHAAERYIERVKPLLDLDGARAEIERLLPMSREVEFPDWLSWERPRSDVAIELSDGIVAVARNGEIITVCIRGSLKPNKRANRNRFKSSRRYSSRSGNFHNRSPRPIPEWNPDE